MRFRLAAMLALVPSLASAQTAPAPEPPGANVAELAPVVVSGAQPGPGMWKVVRGDHELWILGTLTPLPRRIEWQSKEVEATIARAQVVLNPPRVDVKADLGFFGKLGLLPSLIGVRDNPDHKTLKQVVPPDLYARWMTLKTKYIGANRGRNIETWRPIFAAIELYNAAIEKSGLSGSDIVGDVVRNAAKRAGLDRKTQKVQVKVDDPRGAVKQFKRGEMDDLDCFSKTLDRIDADVETMTARANAWATADLEALRNLPGSDQRAACLAAVTETKIARDLGMEDIEARVQQAWIDAASASLAQNAVTFARLPIAELLAPDGYVAKLKAAGYEVESPE